MLTRCDPKRSEKYKNYSGRGISVCDRWKSFSFFLEDMGVCPDGLTLERNDVNDGYYLGNCRWATKTEQRKNRRDSRFILIDGRKTHLLDACKMFNIHPSTVRSRIRNGMDHLLALSTKP